MVQVPGIYKIRHIGQATVSTGAVSAAQRPPGKAAPCPHHRLHALGGLSLSAQQLMAVQLTVSPSSSITAISACIMPASCTGSTTFCTRGHVALHSQHTRTVSMDDVHSKQHITARPPALTEPSSSSNKACPLPSQPQQ